MARLIDAEGMFVDAIKNRRFVFRMEDLLNRQFVFETVYSDLADFINSQPTVDAVEVVRCKDCNFFIDKEDPTYPAGKWESIDGICWRDRKFTCHDDYCSCGAKMGGGDKE